MDHYKTRMKIKFHIMINFIKHTENLALSGKILTKLEIDSTFLKSDESDIDRTNFCKSEIDKSTKTRGWQKGSLGSLRIPRTLRVVSKSPQEQHN